ncbi:MAG: hypothetical protein JO131_08215 [Gammaproteobacteria bacterium]|nr:hypothetical protein [Gammaproteobacteria bacterium]
MSLLLGFNWCIFLNINLDYIKDIVLTIDKKQKLYKQHSGQFSDPRSLGLLSELNKQSEIIINNLQGINNYFTDLKRLALE